MTENNNNEELPPALKDVVDIPSLTSTPVEFQSEKEKVKPNPSGNGKLRQLFNSLSEDENLERCTLCKGYGYIYLGQTSPSRCDYCKGVCYMPKDKHNKK
jgi:hypothetical protein